MVLDIIEWDMYEITTSKSEIHGVKFRGRIRKFALENKRNVLVENASDKENVVRVAIPKGEDISDIKNFGERLAEGVSFNKIESGIKNPVLSKIKVNIEERYEI